MNMTAMNLLRGEQDVRQFPAGRPIFVEGDSADGMYAVLEGEVEIVMDGELRETIPAGGFFGELALLDDHPRSATAMARTDCRIAVVNARRFQALVHRKTLRSTAPTLPLTGLTPSITSRSVPPHRLPTASQHPVQNAKRISLPPLLIGRACSTSGHSRRLVPRLRYTLY
jgi:CRP/FNR family transcriptional regulator, cyclic AMP receptor protein